MISSGMIPSGEKTQADLGRTQYGSAPSPSSLMDAYRTIYEHHQKDADGNVIPHESEEVKEENINELKSRTMLNYIDKASDSASKELDKAEKTTSRKKEVKSRLKMDKRERGIEMAKDKIMKRVKEGVDLFDLVKGKLIDEGVDEKEAIKIMVNLSEEELNELLGGKPGDGYLGHPNLGIKNPLAKKQTKKPVMPGSQGGGLINKTAGQLGDRKMKYQELMKGM